MKLLVTGASGYIGSRLCEKLSATGWDWAALAKKGSASITRIPPGGCILEFEPGKEAVCIERFAPEVVVHCATFFVAQHAPDQISSLVESNIGFGVRVLDALDAARTAMVNIGTSWQHLGELDETPAPSSLYAATKQAFEDLARYYSTSRNLGIFNLKLADTYGPLDWRNKIIPKLIARAVNKETVPLPMSSGLQKIDLLHVDDAVDGILHSIGIAKQMIGSKQFVSRVLHSNQAISLRELVSTMRAVRPNLPFEVQFGALPDRPVDAFGPWLGGTVLEQWTSRVELPDGLREAIQAAESRAACD